MANSGSPSRCVSLGEDDVHPGAPRPLDQPRDDRHGRGGVGHEQRAALADEVVLHVDDDQRGGARIEHDPVVDREVRNGDGLGHGVTVARPPFAQFLDSCSGMLLGHDP